MPSLWSLLSTGKLLTVKIWKASTWQGQGCPVVIYPGSLPAQVSWSSKLEPPLSPQLSTLFRALGGGSHACTLTHYLVLLQIDSLQCRQGGQLLWEVLKLVPGQVDGPEVLQAADLVGEAIEVVALQA